MMLSAEIRWFWPDGPPVTFEAWFVPAGRFPMPAAGGEERCDRYLKPAETAELGIKQRGSAGVQIKGLITRRDRRIGFSSLAAPVEIWGKWSATTLDLAGLPLLSVGKRRWIRRFVPARGPMREVPAGIAAAAGETSRDCEVDFTLLTAPDSSKWWTLGFEAHGPLEAIETALSRAVAAVEAHRPPLLPPGQPGSYPAWLSSQPW